MNYCYSREKFDCIYLTKDNVEEALKVIDSGVFYNNNKYIKVLKDTEKYILIKNEFYNCIKYFYYNSWYVHENNWEYYSEEEFNNKYYLEQIE